MALFKKKKLNNRQKGGVFDPTKTELYIREYENLLDALNSAIEIGGKDFKEVKIVFEDRDVLFYFDGDYLLNVLDPKFKFNISNRLYWASDIPEEEKDTIIENSSDNDLYNYNKLTKFVKDDLLEDFNIFFNKATISNIFDLIEEFDKNTKVVSNVVFDNSKIEELKEHNYLKINIEELSHKIKYQGSKIDEFLISLGISKVPYSEISFKLIEKQENNIHSHNDAEKLILSAVENEATLDFVKEVSDGFSWGTEILNSINSLHERKIIDLDYPGKLDLTLPELDYVPENAEKQYTIKAFKNNLLLFVKNFDLDKDEEEEFNSLINRNYDLEKEIEKINEKINPLQDKYFTNRKDYENKKFDRAFNVEDETKPEVYSIDELSENLYLQNESNGQFEELKTLERERSEKNTERKEIFNKLLELGENCESLDIEKFKDLVNYRISEIEKVENVAFETVDEKMREIEEENIEEFFNTEDTTFDAFNISDDEETEDFVDASEDITLDDVVSEEEDEQVADNEEVATPLPDNTTIDEIEISQNINLENALIYEQLIEKYNI